MQLHTSASVHTLKSPNAGKYTIAGHMKMLHTRIGVGSAALSAAVPYPGKATQISHKGQRSWNRYW